MNFFYFNMVPQSNHGYPSGAAPSSRRPPLFDGSQRPPGPAAVCRKHTGGTFPEQSAGRRLLITI